MTGLMVKRKKLHQLRIRDLKREIDRLERVRYKIVYQWRRSFPVGHQCYWQSWREFGAIPILFFSEQEAQDYLDKVGTFKNMGHLRKPSCSIQRVLLKSQSSS